MEQMTTTEISALYGVAPFTATNWMRRLGIPKRSPSERRSLAYNNPGATKAELHRMYVVEEMSAPVMAKLLDVTDCTILKWMRDAGVPVRSRSEACLIVRKQRAKKPTPYTYVPPQARYIVLARDGFRCCACGRSPKAHGIILNVDHIHPASKGGGNNMDNLQALCEECNVGKSDMVL